MAHMNGVLAMLSGIPWWVFPLLGLLIAIGVRALKTRYAPLPVALIAPVAFTVWGVLTLLRAKPDVAPILSFVIAAIAGVAIAIATTRNRNVVVDAIERRVCLPGSYVPLIRNLAIFSAKFVLTFAVTVHPDLRDTLAPWDLGVSGISAGYFVGWSTWLLAGFSKAIKSGLSRAPG
jgi:hypothetical protein